MAPVGSLIRTSKAAAGLVLTCAFLLVAAASASASVTVNLHLVAIDVGDPAYGYNELHLDVAGTNGKDRIDLAYHAYGNAFGVSANRPIAIRGGYCHRESRRRTRCPAPNPPSYDDPMFVDVDARGGSDEVRFPDPSQYSAGYDQMISGGAGSDLLVGGSGFSFLDGGAGEDELYGQDGDDLLDGGPGRDELRCGGGIDRFYRDPADRQPRSCEDRLKEHRPAP